MKYAKTAVRMVTAAMLVAALAACASKPKRVVVADTGASGMPMPPPSTAPEAFPAPPTGAVMGGPARPGSVQDFVINAGDRVYFDYDSFEIRSDATPVLDSQASWLQRYPGVRVRIEGNADERGTREYNFALGSRRAQAVADYLSGRGVNRGRISTVSYGKERPIDPGSGEDAWSRNRNGHTSIVEGAR